MKNEPTIDLLKRVKTVELDTQEKGTVRKQLASHIKTNPVRKHVHQRHIEMKSIVSRSALLHIFKQKYMLAGIGVIVALITSGGVSYAAEAAVPGDPLYPVKVHINEELVAAVTLDDEEDALWEARRAERRLEEAAILAARGTLNDQHRKDIEKHFDEHTRAAQSRVAGLERRGDVVGAARAAAKLEASLEAHEEILEHIADELAEELIETSDLEGEERYKLFEPLLKKIRSEAKEVRKLRSEVEATREGVIEDVQAEAKNQMQQAMDVLSEVEIFASEANLPEHVREHVHEQLERVDEQIDLGEHLLGEELPKQATRAFLRAVDMAHRVESFIRSHNHVTKHVPLPPVDVSETEDEDEEEHDEIVETEEQDDEHVARDEEERVSEAEIQKIRYRVATLRSALQEIREGLSQITFEVPGHIERRIGAHIRRIGHILDECIEIAEDGKMDVARRVTESADREIDLLREDILKHVVPLKDVVTDEEESAEDEMREHARRAAEIRDRVRRVRAKLAVAQREVAGVDHPFESEFRRIHHVLDEVIEIVGDDRLIVARRVVSHAERDAEQLLKKIEQFYEVVEEKEDPQEESEPEIDEQESVDDREEGMEDNTLVDDDEDDEDEEEEREDDENEDRE